MSTGERQLLDLADDLPDDDDDDTDDEDRTCTACDGTGEGTHDTTNCYVCKGKGII